MGFDPADAYETLVRHSTDLLTIVDEDGVFRYLSPSVEDTLGYEEDDLVGESAFAYVHPDDREHVATLFRELVTSSDPITRRVEFRFRTATDEWRWLESVGSSQSESAVGGYVVTSRDITERKRLERDLKREQRRVTQFVSVLAHDLRNPLTIAREYLNTVRSTDDLSLLPVVHDELDRMEVIVKQTLTTTPVDIHERSITAVNLEDCARSVWEPLSTETGELAVDEELTIEADDRQLSWLFEQLFFNAVEHAGSDVRIEIGPLESDDGFYVEDDGPGIPAALRERVFEAGYTTVEENSGLGLAIVRAIAVAHGWDCTIAETERGTRFEFGDVTTH